MTKHILWISLLTAHSVSVTADNWVRSFGHTQGDVIVAGVVSDSENNAIITGTFNSEVLDLPNGKILENNGTVDVFLVKFDPQGEIIWATSFGGLHEDFATDITVDAENNIYVTGRFRSSSLNIGNETVTSNWPDNVYVASFDKEGTFGWLNHSTRITTTALSKGIHCDTDQNILITGYTNSTNMSFGDIDLYLNNTRNKAFYCKLDKEGNYLMARFLGEEGDVRYMMNDIASDGEGNIYLAGMKTIHTEPDPITWSEYRDVMYFCKADPEGNILWVVEDTAFHRAENIIFHHDSLFVLGNREEYRIIFNGGTIDTTSRFYYGFFDLDAHKLWDREVTGALAYDAFSGNNKIMIIGGLLLDQLDLGGFQIQRNSDSSSICPIYQDIFYLESDRSGQIVKAESISGSLEDIATGIWLTDNGDLLYTGTFESASLWLEQNEIINNSELSIFQHVSGIYYDRRIFAFLARHSAYSGPSGINNDSNNEFMVFPNPSSGMITVKKVNNGGFFSVKVYDISGRIFLETDAAGDPVHLDLSDRSQGIYILSIEERNRVTRKPVLIIK